jgi:ParB-like chromosome segregation protein Spo0J
MNTQTVAPTTTTQPSLNPGHRFHPLVEIFPEMDKNAFAEFVQDIKVNGVREPVTVYHNQIIDGRTRLLACEVLGISCPQRAYDGREEDLLAFVLSKNLQRRHLSTSQRAMIAAEIADMTHGGDRKSDQAGKSQLDSVSRPSRTDAAKMLNVSPETVTTAKKVKDRAEPEVAKAVRDDKLAVSAAAKIAEHPPEVQRQAVAAIAGGAKAAAVVRALPNAGKIDVDEIYRHDREAAAKAKASAPAPTKLSREQKKAQKKAEKNARSVYASLCRLEEESTDDGKALWELAPSEFWPLLHVGVQEQVLHAAKAIAPWLDAIIQHAAESKVGAKPKLVTRGVQ